MRIIHLTLGKGNPSRMNGVSVSIHNLATAQAELGHDVSFWGVTSSYGVHDYPERAFRTELFPGSKTPFMLHTWLQKRLEEVAADGTIFHLHGGLLPILWNVGRILVRRGIPYIYTPHGTFTDGAFEKGFLPKMGYLYAFERLLMHRAAAIMVLGEGERTFIHRHFPKTRIELIPNAQDPLVTHEDIEERQRETDGPLFSFCGRLNRHHKGLDILLEGFAGYQKNGGQGRLLLVGDGPDRDFLKNQAIQLGIRDEVEFAGSLFGEAKRQRLLESDVFVHSSRMEGFPMALLEAAALGLPLLVSEFTNMGDYVRQWKSGWVLPKNDPANVATALADLETQWFRGRLMTAAHRALYMIESQFQCTKIAADVIALYQTAFVDTWKMDSRPAPAMPAPLPLQPMAASLAH